MASFDDTAWDEALFTPPHRPPPTQKHIWQPPKLTDELRAIVENKDSDTAYLVAKGFHFLGQRFRFGGFSHTAVVMFRTGQARFEHLLDESSDGLDMEVHEAALGQRCDVGTALAQRRHMHFDNVQPVVKIQPKLTNKTWYIGKIIKIRSVQ